MSLVKDHQASDMQELGFKQRTSATSSNSLHAVRRLSQKIRRVAPFSWLLLFSTTKCRNTDRKLVVKAPAPVAAPPDARQVSRTNHVVMEVAVYLELGHSVALVDAFLGAIRSI